MFGGDRGACAAALREARLTPAAPTSVCVRNSRRVGWTSCVTLPAFPGHSIGRSQLEAESTPAAKQARRPSILPGRGLTPRQGRRVATDTEDPESKYILQLSADSQPGRPMLKSSTSVGAGNGSA